MNKHKELSENERIVKRFLSYFEKDEKDQKFEIINVKNNGKNEDGFDMIGFLLRKNGNSRKINLTVIRYDPVKTTDWIKFDAASNKIERKIDFEDWYIGHVNLSDLGNHKYDSNFIKEIGDDKVSVFRIL